MKKIITISREYGAGGGEIGKKLAEELGFEYYDKSIILNVAKEANIDVEHADKWDEMVPANFGFAQSLFDFYNRPLSEKLFDAQSKVIKRIGESGNCVIVGRNANSILKEYDHTLHVFLHANRKWRIRRMQEQVEGTTPEKLAEQVENIDKKRKKYCSYYTNTEFGSAEYYDVCLDTGRLGIEQCVKILLEMARE
ncbi:MAG: cytidylate kinase-like family protein [Lachnospiraceae bacterium]|nr:cytidylate kinase-like family protein [Lachnospiraceae bacterium]